MLHCGSCEYFGKNGSVSWCYHPSKNYSTSQNSSACKLYNSKW